MLSSSHTVLDSVAMAYVPAWSRARELVGVRLCVRAMRDDGVDANHLLQAIGEDWPEEAPPLLLQLQTPRLLQQALSCAPVRNTWLEVPASLFAATDTLSRLSLAQRRGHQLLRQGSWEQLRGQRAPAIAHRDLVTLDSGAAGQQPLAGHFAEGAATQAQVRRVLDEAQALAVIGWPSADVLAAHRQAPLAYDPRVVRQVLLVIDDEECSVEHLERLVRQDPVLVYRILMLVNSAAYGLRREIGSLRHAIMMLGFRELGRWLAEQLLEAEEDEDLHPVRYAMVMRARMAQHLLATGSDEQLRAEVFLTAALSQLDQLLHQPLADLLPRLPLNGRVSDAVLRRDGPYHPLLEVASALGDPARMEQMPTLCRRHEFTLEQANRALLRMLATSRDQASRRSQRLLG